MRYQILRRYREEKNPGKATEGSKKQEKNKNKCDILADKWRKGAKEEWSTLANASESSSNAGAASWPFDLEMWIPFYTLSQLFCGMIEMKVWLEEIKKK